MPLDTKALEALRIERDGDTERDGNTSSRWWLGLALAGIVLAIGGYLLLRDTRPVVTTVRVEGAAARGGAAVLNASGYVVARRVATVSAEVTGRLTEVLIEEGSEVQEGQVLARLDTDQAQARTALARRELEAAERNLAEIEVRLAEARRNLTRTEKLRAQALVSETALDTARAEADALEARLDATRAQRQVAASALKVQIRDLEKLEIRAPFSGVVISKDAQPGEMVSPISAGGGFTRTGIATIVDMDSREIEVDVNEAFINRVHPGQKVEATLDAYADWVIPAQVINIVPTADRQKATVKVRIGIEKLDPRILPNMGVKVRFLEDVNSSPALTNAPRLRIPADALVREGDRTYVWVVRDDALEKRAINATLVNDGMAEVHAGIHSGDLIVAPAVEGLTEGTEVRVTERGVAS